MMYRMSELLNGETNLGQKQVQTELSLHGHPKSRKISRQDPNQSEMRTIAEAIAELIEHYKHAHQN